MIFCPAVAGQNEQTNGRFFYPYIFPPGNFKQALNLFISFFQMPLF